MNYEISKDNDVSIVKILDLRMVFESIEPTQAEITDKIENEKK